MKQQQKFVWFLCDAIFLVRILIMMMMMNLSEVEMVKCRNISESSAHRHPITCLLILFSFFFSDAFF